MTTPSTNVPIGGNTFFSKTITPVIFEGISLLPDGILLMSAFFALVTLSLPYAAFFGAMVESTLLFHALKKATLYLNISYPKFGKEQYSPQCRTGFTGATPIQLSGFYPLSGGTFPSAPIFMLSTAGAYVFNTLIQQSKELEMLGPAYSSRFYISMILFTMFILTLGIFRIYHICDTPGVVLASILIGLLVGSLLVVQNRRLLGEDAINLMGIPLLRNRTATGKDLYICPGERKPKTT